jgi:hypothetical protein
MQTTGTIDRIWTEIYGNPAWSVKKGHGSFLTFEFGAPSLQIREPIAVPTHTSARTRTTPVRRVDVVGAWQLWIYCCNWSISFDSSKFAHSESPDSVINSATERLDGQQITALTRGAVRGTWIFSFDLGGKLETWPYGEDPTDEQWLLYERESGHVLVARADDSVSYGSGSERADDHMWHSL